MNHKTSRRSILQFMGAAAGALATRQAWATPPLATWAPSVGGWGGIGTPRKVLEIYLRGGASLWSSFWYDEILGALANGTGDTELADWTRINTFAAEPPATPWTTGMLGPAAQPLATALVLGTAPLADHMRVIRLRHDLAPHEAAIPYATTGRRLGRPQMAGLGAAIWRRRDAEVPGTPGVRSIVFQTGSQVGDRNAAGYSASTGFHPAAFRPVVVPLGDVAFYDALLRTSTRLTDGLKDHYQARYRTRLDHAGAAVRSIGFSAYEASLDVMQVYHDDLRAMLSANYTRLFPPIGTLPDYAGNNLTSAAIDTALDLFADPTYDLWHASVIDGGVETNYDTHGTTTVNGNVLPPAFVHNANIWNVCHSLAMRADDILSAGITVLIHSEFGRKETNNDPADTEHHNDGYACVVISDLIASPGFVGSAGGADLSIAEFVDATGSQGLTPTDVHAAVAQLAGIHPYQPDMFENDVDLSRTGIADLSSGTPIPIAAETLLDIL